MNIEYVRSSSIGTYRDCPHKYFLEYVLQIPCPAGKKALLGTIIHHVLEIMARAKRTGHHKLKDKYIDPKYLLDICWKRYTDEEADRFQFTNADYKFCVKSIDKVLTSLYNPLDLNVIKTEQRFKIPITKPGFEFEYHDLATKQVKKGQYEIRGTVDLITQSGKDSIEIVDWKTGKRRCWISGKDKDHESLRDDIQLRLYDLAVSLLYPNYEHIMFTIYYINDGGPFTVAFTPEDREETYQILLKEFNTIQNDM